MYKVTKTRVVVADPAEGIIKYKLEEFKKIWTGYLVILVPLINIYTDTSNEKVESNLLKQLISINKSTIIQIIIISLIISILSLISTFYSKLLIDDIFPSESASGLKAITIIFFSVSVVTIILNYVNTYIGIYFKQKLTIPLELRLINHIIKLPLKFFETRKTSEILARIEDVDQVSILTSTISIQLVLNCIMACLGGIALFIFDNSIFLIGCISVVIYYAIFRVFKENIKEKTRETIRKDEGLSQHKIELVKSIQTIKSTCSIEYITDNYEIAMSSYIKHQIDLEKYMMNYSTLISTIKLVFNSIITFIVASTVLNGEITIGTMMLFSTIFSLFINPLESIINLQPQIETMKVSLNRLKEVLTIDSEEDYKAIKIHDFKKDITIKNLEFWYTNRKPAIKGINMKIKNNSTIALIGESGSGKSTLAKIIASLYKPEKGEILLGDIDISSICVNSLRKHIVYVQQEFQFITESILNNLTISCEKIDFEKVVELCKEVGINDIINNLEFGYNTILNEDANIFSQGEKQRLNLVRALLLNPDILILDEVTSNLDYMTEKKYLSY